MRAALINTDSFTVQLTRDMPDTKALEWLQSKVDGWIEHVHTPGLIADGPIDVGVYINEEGKFVEDPQVNPTATRLMFGLRGTEALPASLPDVIVGNAVLVATDMRTGDSVDLPQEVIDSLRARGFRVAVEIAPVASEGAES